MLELNSIEEERARAGQQNTAFGPCSMLSWKGGGSYEKGRRDDSSA